MSGWTRYEGVVAGTGDIRDSKDALELSAPGILGPPTGRRFCGAVVVEAEELYNRGEGLEIGNPAIPPPAAPTVAVEPPC